jgi:hypothetical protein
MVKYVLSMMKMKLIKKVIFRVIVFLPVCSYCHTMLGFINHRVDLPNCALFCYSRGLKGGGKSASDIVYENRMRKLRANKENNLKKRKRYNLNKKIDVKGIAGYFFKKKYDDAYMMKLHKPSFSRYTHITLKNSPMIGLCSITLSTYDPLIKDGASIEEEINRMAKIFCKKYGVSFTSDIKISRNKNQSSLITHGQFATVTSGLSGINNTHGHYNEITHVYGTPSSVSYILTETFSDCIVKINGVHNLKDNSCRVDFCIELNI